MEKRARVQWNRRADLCKITIKKWERSRYEVQNLQSLSLIHILIKCIVIAYGNDASVAMAEYIGGDEGTFVRMMNERAAGLGMERTRFVDCCGLTDSPDHVTTARDIALMSRELITKYPQIINYSTIWMENITHAVSYTHLAMDTPRAAPVAPLA